MICSLTELKDKDIINICSGENLGYADDVCLDTKTAAVTGLIIYGKPRYFGIFGPREKYIVSYENIRLIGKDVILAEIGKKGDLYNLDKI
ncbi:MAG: YlmC/YmxH family sporulation protein [Oscillospiraceae bacterium]|nr:YlmC/YmxH family sporulation protein [Oscillospiraceae bacterium]